MNKFRLRAIGKGIHAAKIRAGGASPRTNTDKHPHGTYAASAKPHFSAGFILLAIAIIPLAGCRDSTPAKVEAATSTVAQPTTAEQPSAGADAGPTTTPRRETLRKYAPAVGNFRARQLTKISPQVSGRVQEILVEVGTIVKKDQVLVRLDQTYFQLDVQQSEASVAAAKALLAVASVDVATTEREMNRQLGLFEKGVNTPKERDDTISAYNRSVANQAEKAAKLTEAEKRLEYLKENLKKSEIRAPYDGVITARMVDLGEYATLMPQTQLVEIQEVGTLYLEFSLPQELLSDIRNGTPLQYEVEGVANSNSAAEITTVFPSVDPMTRAFRCRAVVENANHKFQPGLLVKVNVVLQEAKDALVVPRTSLSRTASGWQVIVMADGKSSPKAIEVGLITEDLAQVIKGLSESDHVVTTAGRS